MLRRLSGKLMIALGAGAMVVGAIRTYSFTMLAAFSDVGRAWREGDPDFQDWPFIVAYQLGFICVAFAGGLWLIRCGSRWASQEQLTPLGPR
jgi:hypothetical protein